MVALIVFDAYFIFKILNDIKKDCSYENVTKVTIKTYLDKIDIIIVLLIIAVVFTFMPEIKIFSVGMTLFYGIIGIAISNIVFMRNMLIARYK